MDDQNTDKAGYERVNSSPRSVYVIKTATIIFCVGFLLLGLAAITHHAQAATTTCNWTDNGGAGDNNWNTATNWSCGNVPNNTDNVILNSTANYPLTINATATAASFTTNSGYTQTITANANLTLDTSQGGTGTFTLATSTSYNANATTLNIPGSWNTSTSTFVSASSTVNFTASTTGQTIQSNSNQFNTLTFNGTSPGAWTLQGNLTAASLTLTSGNLIDGGIQVTVNGNISIANTTGLLTSTGMWIQGASGNISNPNSGNPFKKLTIAGSGVTTTMTGNVWVGLTGGGTLTLGSGTLNGANKTLYLYAASNNALTVNNLTVGSSLADFYYTLQSSVTQNAITLPNGFGPVVINLNSGTPSNLTATGNFNFGNNGVVIANSGVTGTPTNYLNMATSTLTCGLLWIGSGTGNGYLKLGNNASHSVGVIAQGGTGTANILDMESSTITSSGNVNFTNITVVQGSSTLVMTATSSLTSAGQTLNNLTYNSSGTLTLNDNPTIGGNFIISAGAVSPGSTTVTMNGNGGVLTSNSRPLNNLTVEGNTTLGGNVTLLGNLAINSSTTLNTGGSSYAVTVGGNWTNSGTYTGNSSPVVLDSAGNQMITGSNTFYQLTASASSTSRTLTFTNGTTQTISNALSLTGSGGNLLLLRSDSQGHSWNITPNGSRTVSYVDVEDSYNTVAGNPIVATNSNDSGDNTNWTITPPPLTVSVQAANPIGETTATLNGTIASTGGTNPYVEGFYLYNGSTCSGSVIQNPNNTGGSYGAGSYLLTVTGLSSAAQYSYTAYATNSTQTSTSTCQSFSTTGAVYYIVSGNNTWVRGSISSNEDIAQQYITFGTTNNHNFNYGTAYIINSSTPNSITSYQTGISMATGGDDAAPINTANVGYIMSDHGLNSPVITATSDKTSSDIGSTWQDSGGHQFILAGVSGTGTETLTFYSIPYGSPWYYATGVTGTTLTWISGGVHETTITVTFQTDVQQYPVVENVVEQILVNGTTTVTSGASGYANYVDMSESYDLVDPSTINTGNNPFVWNSATGIWLHVTNVYQATAGTTVVHSTYTVERPMNLGYFGVVQVGAITAPSYQNQYYYIPKTDPVNGYNFTTPQLFNSAPTSTIIFNGSNIANSNDPPDRQIIFFKNPADSTYDVGFTFGYSPYGSTASSSRSCTSYTDGCWWIYTSKKTYPVVDGGTGVVNNTTYDSYAYRQWIDPTQYDIGKSAYWNNLKGHELVYVDYYRSAASDTTVLPSTFDGWGVKVIDSSNIQTPASNVSSNGVLTLSTTGSNTSGYAELELSPQITSFNLTSPAATGTINNTNNTVTITVPYGTNVTNLSATIAVSSGATISPASGAEENFTSPVVYTVTGADGVTTSTYTVTVTTSAGSTDATLSSLTVSLGTLSPTFASSTTSYTVVLPYGTISAPTVTATTDDPNATSTITQGASPTGSATVLVTAQNGTTTKTYTVNFSVAHNPSATAFTFTGPSSGLTNATSSNFTVTPNGAYSGTITITPSGGGLSTPTVLTFSNTSTPQTFTITPTATGTVTLTPTNNGSLTNPSSLTCTVTNAPTVPDAPTGVSATAGSQQATVSFTAPSNGGSSILYYTASSSPGGILATSSTTSIVVTGLTNGQAYIFTVTATNAVGTGPASSPSGSVTPLAPIVSGGGGDGGSIYYTLSLTKSGSGTGTIIGAGLNCGSSCSAPFASGQTLTFTATPSASSTFAGWVGDCSSSGTSTVCSLTITTNKTATAIFNLLSALPGTIVSTGSTTPLSNSTTTPSSTTPSTTPPVLIPSPMAPNVPIRLIDRNGTFYLIINNVSHGITDPGMLNSYGFNFSNAVAATPADLSLPQGSLLTPDDGALVKSPQDPTIYLVSGQQRHGFASASVFLGLGFRWSSVLTVTTPELNQQPIGTIISDPLSQHLPGLDINKNGTIYWIGLDNELHGYPSLAVYNSWHIANDFSVVVPANAADMALPVGSLVSARVLQ